MSQRGHCAAVTPKRAWERGQRCVRAATMVRFGVPLCLIHAATVDRMVGRKGIADTLLFVRSVWKRREAEEPWGG